MHRRPAQSFRALLATIILVAAGLTVASPANAASLRTFSNTYSATLHGDIAAIGNANSTCSPSWTPATSCDTNSQTVNNSNHGYGVLIDTDGDASTTNSSSSTVSIPAGATIVQARLTWGATGDNTDDNGEATVKLDTPAEAGINYHPVSATYASQCGGFSSDNANRGFACSADVTALAQAGGAGTYTVGGIEQRQSTFLDSDGNGTDSVDHWSGWGLYIVYSKPSEPLRRIVLSDGFQKVATATPTASVSLTGFTAPASGTVTARLTYAVGEGDANILNDNAKLNSTTLDSRSTPDLMDSQISGLTHEASRSPSYLNNYGFDFHSQQVDGAIPNGATSASFDFTTSGDTYYPFSTGITIDLSEPNVVLTKTLTDVNGGVVEAGDVLRYQIVAVNQGNDGASDVDITDQIPVHSTYVPGSMKVTAGADVGSRTDAAGDDQAEFDGTGVTMRVGSGATSSAGGILTANGGTATVTFDVVLDNNVGEGTSVVNTANGSYQGQTSLDSYSNPSTVASTPVRRADLTVTQTTGTLTAGQQGSISLTANNIGGASTHGNAVTLTTSVPTGMTFGSITSSTGWTCNTASLPTITCTRSDDLAGNSSYPVVTYTVTPSQTATNVTFNASVSGGNENDTTNDTASNAITVQRSADLRVTNLVDKATANVGDTLTYTINGRNLGPSTTTGVQVTSTLPSGLQPLTAKIGATNCTISGQAITCPSPGTLDVSGAAADTATITVTAKVLPAAGGTTRTVSAAIAGNDPDPVSGNNSASAATTINAAGDIQLTESVSPSSVNPGSNATYTFTVKNNGPNTATSVVLTDTLPSGVTVVSRTPSGSGTCGTGNPFTCSFPSIASGASETVAVVVTPALSTAGTSLVNAGSVTSSTTDYDSSNDTATASLTVNPAADLHTTVVASPSSVHVGDGVDYLVTVKNEGGQSAASPSVSVDLPDGETVGTVTPSSGGTCGSGDPRTCTFGTLASGASVTIAVHVTTTLAGGGTAALSATASSTTYDPVSGNNTASDSATVAASADVQVTETRSPASVNPGSNATFTFTVKNNGPSTATGVVLTDDLPSGVTVQSITPSGSGTCGTGNPFTCTFASLASGASETVTVVVRPALSTAGTTLTNPGSISTTTFDGNAANDTATASVDVNPAADLRTTVTATPTTATVGDTVDYLVTVHNDGPQSAAGSTVSLNLPSGATVVSVTPSSGVTCASSGNPRSCTLGTLANGDAPTVAVRVTLNGASAGTNATLAATAATTTYDPVSGNDAASASTAVDQPADLKLTESASPSTLNPGSDATYTFTIKNNGPGAAKGIVLSDDLPAGATVQSITPSQGTCGTGDPFTCSIGTLANGNSATVTVVLRPALSSAGSSLANPGVVTSASYDPATADNSATASVTVNDAADLRTTVTSPATAAVGDTIDYVVTVHNDGPSSAAGGSVSLDLPDGATLISVTPSSGVTCPSSGDPRTCTLPTLANGDVPTITVRVKLTPANANSNASLVANASATTFDPSTANNADTGTTSVGIAADLQVTETRSPATVNPGSDATFTITVKNNGPQDAPNVVLTDNLPAGATVQSITPSAGVTCGTGDPFTCTLASLASGDSATVVVVLRPTLASAGSTLANPVSATSDTNDPNPDDNSATASVDVNPAADLRVSASVDHSTAAVGDTLNYLFTVTNDGPSTATSPALLVHLPAGATIVSVTPSSGASCPSSGANRNCTFPAVASGATVTVAVQLQVTNANAGSTIAVSGDASAAEFDPTAGNNSASATSSAGDAADLSVTKTSDHPTANVGDTITWTVTVHNGGPQSALGTTVSDSIPAGVTITGATSTVGSCTVGSTISCAVGTLTSGSDAVITVTGVVQRSAAGSPLTSSASVTGSVFDPDTSNNVSPTSTTTVGPAADLRLVKVVDKPAPKVGETVTWTIQVFNDGPSAASSVHLTDVVPAGAPITSVTGSQSGCTQSGQTVDCVFGSIAGGSSATVTITATVNAGGASLNNSATVTSATLDPDTSNNTSTANSTAAGAADLSITLTPDRDAATVGQRITWNGLVSNGGPQTAHGTVVTLTLPDGLTDIQATTPGGTCTISGKTVTCLVVDVPAGTTQTVTISGGVTRDAAEKSLALSGMVAANETDPAPADNAGSAKVVAIAPAVDLTLTKTADKDTVTVDQPLTVTSTVVNKGPSTATDVIVTDTIPEGVELQSVSPSQGSCTVSGKTITCNLGVLADGQKASISTVVIVRSVAAGQKLLSGGTVTSAQVDLNVADNEAEASSAGVGGVVEPAPSIDLTKVVDKPAPVLGDTVVYTITAKNSGNAAATNVRVVDALPAGLTYKGTKVTGATCNRAARTVTCVAPTLAAGASIVVKITAVVDAANVSNTASVTATGLPTTPAKGQLAVASVRASGGPYVVAGIHPLEAYTRPGRQVRIAVKITNVGQGTATGNQACFTLPRAVVLTKMPAGVTQKGSKFCLTAASLAAGKHKRIVLAARVVGTAGKAKPTLTAKSANAKTKVETYAVTIRGARVTRAAGVTG
jgi:uncharacterized repeat protein (TIGR01451 family)